MHNTNIVYEPYTCSIFFPKNIFDIKKGDSNACAQKYGPIHGGVAGRGCWWSIRWFTSIAKLYTYYYYMQRCVCVGARASNPDMQISARAIYHTRQTHVCDRLVSWWCRLLLKWLARFPRTPMMRLNQLRWVDCGCWYRVLNPHWTIRMRDFLERMKFMFRWNVHFRSN